MFILEGPDNSGKSSLMEKLSHRYSLQTLKKAVNSDRTAAVSPDAYLRATLTYEIATEPWLLDRFYLISASIYGPILGVNGHMSAPNRPLENPDWAQEMWRLFNEQHRHGRIFVIWCLPPLETVREHSINDPYMDQALFPNFNRIYWSYHTFAYRNLVAFPEHSWIYDWTKGEEGDEEFYNWFEKALDSHRQGDYRV